VINIIYENSQDEDFRSEKPLKLHKIGIISVRVFKNWFRRLLQDFGTQISVIQQGSPRCLVKIGAAIRCHYNKLLLSKGLFSHITITTLTFLLLLIHIE
jgi:hypothetical protein